MNNYFKIYHDTSWKYLYKYIYFAWPDNLINPIVLGIIRPSSTGTFSEHEEVQMSGTDTIMYTIMYHAYGT